jgi:NAD-dependent deacetylase
MSSALVPPELIAALRRAHHVAVLTGAGVSAESGVPTFRDAQTGLWSQFNPQELATRDAFRRNPRLVWEWYAHRRALLVDVEPNPGHYALAELERFVPHVTLLTQNIDGLHRRAGSRNVVELHGSLSRFKCFAEDTLVTEFAEGDDVPPRCPRCRSYLRPDVVWFGEALPPAALSSAFYAAETCDLFFSIGTSGVVEPAASLPFTALHHGAVVVEINPELTPLSEHAAFRLAAPSGEALPLLVRATWTPPLTRGRKGV